MQSVLLTDAGMKPKARAMFVGCFAAILGGCGDDGLGRIACNDKFRQHCFGFRFRLTVAVETPAGLKTGTSVIQVKLSASSPDSWPYSAMGWFGEAPFVDLGGGRHVIALLATQKDGCGLFSPRSILRRHLNARGDDTTSPPPPLRWDAMHQHQGPIQLRLDASANELPTLARFRDVTDHTSFEFVAADTFAATFGTGIRLHSVTLEFTRDPVTRSLRTHLPWAFPVTHLNAIVVGKREGSISSISAAFGALPEGSALKTKWKIHTEMQAFGRCIHPGVLIKNYENGWAARTTEDRP
jgi:hypothetical protein